MSIRDAGQFRGNAEVRVRCHVVLLATIPLPEDIEQAADLRCRPNSRESEIGKTSLMPHDQFWGIQNGTYVVACTV